MKEKLGGGRRLGLMPQPQIDKNLGKRKRGEGTSWLDRNKANEKTKISAL